VKEGGGATCGGATCGGTFECSIKLLFDQNINIQLGSSFWALH